MRILILGDKHIGCRGGNKSFLTFVYEYLKHIVEVIRHNDIDRVIVLGDIMDRRKSTDNFVIHFVVQIISKLIESTGVRWDIIVGNHDTYYKNRIDINTPVNLIHANNVHVYDKMFEAEGLVYIPWLCESNLDSLNRMDVDGKYVFGHFEFADFAMYRGTISKSGLEPNLFKYAKRVFSGHYHTRSEKGNITYVGSPYWLTWQDYGDARGYHILDTETGECDFTRTSDMFNMFECLVYNSDDAEFMKNADDPEWIENRLKDKICKIVVEKRDRPRKFKQFAQLAKNVQVIDLIFIDKTVTDTTTSELSEEELNTDTISVFGNYLDETDGYDETDKAHIMNNINVYYKKASEIDV